MFWVFCWILTCFHMRIPKPCLSVCPSVHLSVPREKKLPWLCQYQSYISNWYISGKVFTSTTPWKPKNLQKNSQKVWNSNYASPSSGEAYRDRQLTTNFKFWVEIFCVPTWFHVRLPKPCLSVCLSICPYPEKRNHHSFVNISPTLVIDTSMEKSSRILQYGNLKIWIFFKKVRNSNFDFWRRAEISLASSKSALH